MAAVRQCSWKEASEGLDLATGERHRIVVPSPSLIVRFEMDPNGASDLDPESYTLTGGMTKEAPKYQQKKTAKDDLVKGDTYIDIEFSKLIPNLFYWLEVDPGGGKPKYMAFEALPWEKIGL